MQVSAEHFPSSAMMQAAKMRKTVRTPLCMPRTRMNKSVHAARACRLHFRFEPPREHVQAASADDDGPIIRRIDGMPQARPNFEAQNAGLADTASVHNSRQPEDTVAQPAAPSVSIPAMEESLLGRSG